MLLSASGRLFLIGGATVDSSGNVVCVSKVESYNTITDTWTTIKSMLEPRAEAACCLLNNTIYVVGGYSWNTNKRLKSVECYNIEKECWSYCAEIATPYTGIGCCALTVYTFPEAGSDIADKVEESIVPSICKDQMTDCTAQYNDIDSHVCGDSRPTSATSFLVSKAPSMPY